MTNRIPKGISRRTLFSGSAALLTAIAQPSWAQILNSITQEHIGGLTFDGPNLVRAQDGIWRSEDGGTSWHKSAGTDLGQVTDLVSHPDQPGLIYASHTTAGVLRSGDGGRTWLASAQGLPQAPIDAITIAAQDPNMIYAAVRGDGLWRSQDAAQSWEFVMDRPFIEATERNVLSLASVNDPTGMGGIWIYAGTEIGVTRVPDCFCRWQGVQSGDAMDALVAGREPTAEVPLPKGEPVQSLATTAQMPQMIFAGLPSGIWKTSDAGVTWAHVSDAVQPRIAINPADPNQVVAITKGETLISRDGGQKWSSAPTI